MPKPNGYRSLHTTVITPSKLIAEFQIRTEEMHEFAERGLAASFHYNEQKNSKDYISGATSKMRNANGSRLEVKGNAGLSSELQWIVQLQDVAQRLRDAAHRPATQRLGAGEHAGERLSGQQARQQPDRRA